MELTNDEELTSPYVIEREVRLSESVLWQLERNAYAEMGPSAWTQHGVPFYITSNPVICKGYAAVVMGHLRDCYRLCADTQEPFYIVELGAGIGRFGYLFLKELCSLLDSLAAAFKGLKFCYVLTDISQKNIDFWMDHPLLKSYVNRGVLDFSLYDAFAETSLALLKSRKVLSKETLANPLTVIANYFFDSLPQDLFQLIDGALQEGVITLSTKAKPHDAFRKPEFIQDVMTEYGWHSISRVENYYKKNAKLNDVLGTYSRELKDAQFLIPAAGIECIDNLLKLSNGRMLLLSGDKGVGTLDEVLKHSQIKPVHHTTFSFQVNFHALSLYYAEQAACFLLPKEPTPPFMVAAIGFGKAGFSETASAYYSSLDAFTPQNYWTLINQISAECPNPSLNHILNLLKLGNWDPALLQTFLKPLHASLASADENQRELLEKAVDLAWENYYPTSLDESSFIGNLGLLFFEMKRYSKALLYSQRAQTLLCNSPQSR